MKIAILCTAFLALLQLCLGMAISAMRGKYRQSVGAPDDPNHPLSKFRLALSNCAEWHPILIALMLIVPMNGAPGWTIWVFSAVVVARYLMVLGLTTYPPTRPNWARFLGGVGTYILGLIMVGVVLVSYWPRGISNPTHP